MLARHRDALVGRTVELGCGAGRLTRVLAGLSDDVRAFDVSPLMVAACRRNVPEATVAVADLRDLSGLGDGSAAAVVAEANLIDVLGHAERVRSLAELHRVLDPDGLLLFSSHNRAHLPYMRPGVSALPPGALRSPSDLARALWHLRLLPSSVRHRRVAVRYEREEADYAIVNEAVHEHRLAHYHIRRDTQERQLAAAGFTLIECRARDGSPVVASDDAAHSPSLHYAATATLAQMKLGERPVGNGRA